MNRSPISLLSRRQVLQAGAIGYLGLSLPRLLRAEAARSTASADACIVIFLDGGPSHLDMWDMKPDAPKEIRGEFQPIATTVPGIQLSEHLPRLAKLVHHSTILRSVHHSVNNAHAAAVYTALTGHDRGEIGGGTRPTDNPAIGSVVSIQRPPTTPVVPYVALPYVTKEGAGGPPQPGFFGGLLGRTRDPLWVLNDPNSPTFAVPELTPASDMPLARLGDRRDLLRGVGELDPIQQKAFDLLTSKETQRAFRLDLESVKTARFVRPEHLRPERVARSPIDRSGIARGLYLLGAGRECDVGYARQQLRFAQDAAVAPARCGGFHSDQRSRSSWHVEADAGCRHGRIWPLAEGESGGWPRSLEFLLWANDGRRRHQGWACLRRQRQDRRPAIEQPGRAGGCRGHDLSLYGHFERSGTARQPGSAIPTRPVGRRDSRCGGVNVENKSRNAGPFGGTRVRPYWLRIADYEAG